MKLKFKQPLYKSVITSVKDIDEKGKVIFYASVFGTADRVRDIVDKGAYSKTISENFKEIQHYKNHDSTLMPGVLSELTEDDYGLKAVSNLILKTQLGLETYEEYKAMASAGKSMPHSIGYFPVKEEKGADEFNHLKEIILFEVSSLTKRPAHPGAVTLDVKSFDDLNFEELVKEEQFYTNLLNCKFTDAKLENLERVKEYISTLIASRKNPLDNNKPLMTKDEIINILKF